VGGPDTPRAPYISAKESSSATSNQDSRQGAENRAYCGGGFRSALAADALQKMGYTSVISLDGGWRAWNEGRAGGGKSRFKGRLAVAKHFDENT